MAPTSSSSQIVSTWSPDGLPTGDYCVRTADGTVWRVHAGAPSYCGTGGAQGYVYKDRIVRK